MMQEKKKYQINIFDESYTIVSDEPENEIKNAISHVNSLINEITENSGNRDIKKIAVLVALKIAKQMIRLEENNRLIKHHENSLIDKIENELHHLN